MTELKHVLQKMMSLVAPVEPASTDSASADVLDFDPVWHGDHWQNLLSSPMDARHYVMEDWAIPFKYEVADAPVQDVIDEVVEEKAA